MCPPSYHHNGFMAARELRVNSRGFNQIQVYICDCKTGPKTCCMDQSAVWYPCCTEALPYNVRMKFIQFFNIFRTTWKKIRQTTCNRYTDSHVAFCQPFAYACAKVTSVFVNTEKRYLYSYKRIQKRKINVKYV